MMTETIESLLNSGQILMNLGNPKDALMIYDKILAQDPKHVVALLKKGHILGQLARYSDAIIQYDNVLSQEKNLLALLNKGLAHHYLGQVDVALDCYEQVLKEKPNNPTTLYNKASSLIKSGRVLEGMQILSKVIELDFSFKEKAKFDIEFEGIRKLNEFKKIIS